MVTKNPISQLQEWSVAELKIFPVYTFEEVATQEFICNIKIGELTAMARAKGKKAAKTLAAEYLLQDIGLMKKSLPQCQLPVSVNGTPRKESVTPSCNVSSMHNLSISNINAEKKSKLLSVTPAKASEVVHSFSSLSDNLDLNKKKSVSLSNAHKSCDSIDSVASTSKSSLPVDDDLPSPVTLLALEMKKKNVIPVYELISVINTDAEPPVYFYEVTALENAIGSGPCEKTAKENAASSLLDILKISCKISCDKLNNIDYVGKLLTFCANSKIKDLPKFVVIHCEGDPHRLEFVMQCSVGSFSIQQSAPNKKKAKQLCAKEMLKKLEANFKKDEIKFDSRLLDSDVNEEAWRRLKETNVRSQIKIQAHSDIASVAIKDYIHLFENDFYGKSKVLDELRASEANDILNHPDPEGFFKSIVHELGIQYELSSLACQELFHLNLFLKSQPNWSFLETGSTVEEVKRKLYTSVLKFFYTMVQTS